jgi:hypothetical protein
VTPTVLSNDDQLSIIINGEDEYGITAAHIAWTQPSPATGAANESTNSCSEGICSWVFRPSEDSPNEWYVPGTYQWALISLTNANGLYTQYFANGTWRIYDPRLGVYIASGTHTMSAPDIIWSP